MAEAEIDLVVNAFERTYRETLTPGVFPRIEEENRRRFARKVVLINNVADPADARSRAESLVGRGEIDAFFFVADRLERALRTCSLTRAELGRIPHYSDCALVAVTLEGSPFLLYWDAEVHLDRPCNWVDPAAGLMEADRRVFAANPTSWRREVDWSTFDHTGPFALGYGFSDAVFLGRRADFSRPIYRDRCLISLRYPLSHIAADFEQRVDAHMRRHRLLRATHTGVVYRHPESEGGGYPKPTLLEALRHVRNHLIVRAAARSYIDHPCLKV
ncbi:MAG: hypothetical protein PHQ91_13870 [Thermoanaerobaculaceae bacterium]|nr:hypothetical protein [Thermoanaerobaculaceae bacterium]